MTPRECFPGTPRPGQMETIEKILEAFQTKRFVALEGETGAGKSLIGYALARYMKSCYYLTYMKQLQDQLIEDFGPEGAITTAAGAPSMAILKGRNAYLCQYDVLQELPDSGICPDRLVFRDSLPENTSMQEIALFEEQSNVRVWDRPACDWGICKQYGRSSYQECKVQAICPYINAKITAAGNPLSILNYHSFVFNVRWFDFFELFEPRKLLILDEAHKLEDAIGSLVSAPINFDHLESLAMYPLPPFEPLDNRANTQDHRVRVRELLQFFEKENWIERLNNLLKGLKKTEDDYEHACKILNVIRAVARHPDNWVVEYTAEKRKKHKSKGPRHKISFKPIETGPFAEKLFYNQCEKTLLMSATLGRKEMVCRMAGINPQDCEFVPFKNNFPVKRRPVVARYCGPLNRSAKVRGGPIPYQENKKRMILITDALCTNHFEERGIIHTHADAIRKDLIENCAPGVRCRFLTQDKFDNDKQAMLDEFFTRPDAIIVASAMYEGVDLKDDKARFQIIVKVPFPFKGDPQIRARDEQIPGWGLANASLRIKQAWGRIMRHPEDHGVTYLLDSSFEWFVPRMVSINNLGTDFETAMRFNNIDVQDKNQWR